MYFWQSDLYKNRLFQNCCALFCITFYLQLCMWKGARFKYFVIARHASIEYVIADQFISSVAKFPGRLHRPTQYSTAILEFT